MIKKILTAAIVCAAQAYTIAPSFAQQSENSLRWASAVSIASPDPYYNTAREMVIVTSQEVWDTLIYRDPKTQNYEPLLAETWGWLDNKTLQFTLRSDVKWHNGAPLAVADAVYTLNYIADPANKLPNQSFVEWIDKAVAVDDRTFKLHLKAPFPPAVEYLSSVLPILPDGFYGADGRPPAVADIVGTGPYRMTEFVSGSITEVVRNDNYFNNGPKGTPSFDKIILRTIPDVSTQIAELLSGGVDWLWNVPPDQRELLEAQSSLVVQSGETMRFSYLQMETRQPEGKTNPLKDVSVRQAIAQAIDRQAIIDNLIGKPSRIPSALCFETQLGCTSDVQLVQYNPDNAKKLLAEAGYGNGFTVDLQGFRNRDWVDAVGGYLAAVGIEVKSNFVPYAQAQQRISEGKSGLTLSDWGSFSINDAYAALKPFFDQSSYDTAQDPLMTEQVKAAMSTPDVAARKAGYEMVLERNAEQLYVLPMWTHSNLYAYSNQLEYTPYPDENPRFYLNGWK